MKTGKMTEPEVNRVRAKPSGDDLEAGLGERLRGEMRETWRLGVFSLRAPEGKPETRAWPAGRMLAAATALANAGRRRRAPLFQQPKPHGECSRLAPGRNRGHGPAEPRHADELPCRDLRCGRPAPALFAFMAGVRRQPG